MSNAHQWCTLVKALGIQERHGLHLYRDTELEKHSESSSNTDSDCWLCNAAQCGEELQAFSQDRQAWVHRLALSFQLSVGQTIYLFEDTGNRI